MTTLVLSYNRIQKSLKSQINSFSLPAINWKLVILAGVLMTAAMLVYYVIEINYLTRGSYLINSYSKQISDLSSENKNLEVSFAENSFLGQALVKIEALNFQKVTSVKYIQILDSSFASAKSKP